jgi:segregation and condensation protein A
VRVADLELDLDVFAGPFDLLLTLVLREEVDLLEVDLAEVVLAYIDHLEARGELDLEVATEFLVLIAALLELKSRLMLPRSEDDELVELEPDEAVEELLARMLESRRYRSAAGELQRRLEAEEGSRHRQAQLPQWLRTLNLAEAEAVYDPARLGRALGGLLRTPDRVRVEHLRAPRVSLGSRLELLRTLLRRGRFSFEEAVADADRQTVAVTVFALLELHKRGEASWLQEACFEEITVTAAAAEGAGARAEPGGRGGHADVGDGEMAGAGALSAPVGER